MMDVETALLKSVSFPFAATQAEVIAEIRGLHLYDVFSEAIGKSPAFELSKADMISNYVTSPNVSESGVSISISDRKTLIGIANGIYRKYNETGSLILEEHPTVTPIQD